MHLALDERISISTSCINQSCNFSYHFHICVPSRFTGCQNFCSYRLGIFVLSHILLDIIKRNLLHLVEHLAAICCEALEPAAGKPSRQMSEKGKCVDCRSTRKDGLGELIDSLLSQSDETVISWLDIICIDCGHDNCCSDGSNVLPEIFRTGKQTPQQVMDFLQLNRAMRLGGISMKVLLTHSSVPSPFVPIWYESYIKTPPH